MYNLFFQPLVDILKYIYLFIVKLTGNYGLSLILLSIVVNIILRPISNWAAKVQNKERKIQGILAPQIADIKKNYHGAEQHAELNELYKAYGYNPIYAVRSGLDLFIQLPLLTAAYIMLSSLDALNGQSFGIIKNLLLPDNLFMGINILPILMTVINFLATLTTKSFTKRERVQAFIIAILFLILLYDAPSALLIYWTMNNFIMLIKNFADVKAVSSCFEKISQILNYRYTPSGLWVAVVRVLTFLLMFAFTTIYFYAFTRGIRGTDNELLGNLYCVIVACAVIFVWTLFTKFLEHEFSIGELIVKSLIFILITCGVALYLKYVMLDKKVIETIISSPSARFFIAITVAYIISGFILLISPKKAVSVISRVTDGRENMLFFSSIIAISIFLFVFSPSILYNSDPLFFTNTLLNLFSVTIRYCVIFLLILTIIWLVLPEIMRKGFAVIMAFTACLFLINAFILTESTGPIDGIKFVAMPIAIRKDFISVILSFLIIAVFAWKKRINYFINFMIVLIFSMSAVSAYCYINVRDYGDDTDKTQLEAIHPDYHNDLWSFSRNNKNVVGLFLDAFTGDHVERILAEDPNLAKRLEGFVFFPDTIATGAGTAYSTTSIYGGSEYNPQVLNEKFPNKTLAMKYAEANLVLPNAFAAAGYDVVIASGAKLDANDKYFADNIDKSVKVIFDFRWGMDYIQYWEKFAKENNIKYKIDEEATPLYISILGLSRGIPFSLRMATYYYLSKIGNGSDIGTQFQLQEFFLPQIALYFMKDLAFIDDNSKPKFKFMYSALTHGSWHLSANSLQPVSDPYSETLGQSTIVDGVIPEHYYTDRHALNFIADFAEALKKLGVYDNTRLVIFSDHDASDSWRLHQIFDNASYPGAPNSLMLFKDFNAHGDMRTSDALMSCEDVPALLLSGIQSVKGIPDMEHLKKITGQDRIRTHFIPVARGQDDTEYLFNPRIIYEIKGTMFKKENWKEIYSNNK